MAYQQDFLDDDNQKQQNGTTIGPSSNSSAGAPGSTSGSSTVGSAQSAAPSSGTGFQNLSNYVTANQDQSAGMANTITGGIDSNISKANSANNDYVQSVGDTAKQNTVSNDNVIGQLSQNPNSRSDADWQKDYNQQTQGYQGPTDATSFQPYQDLQSQYGNIDSQVKSLQDPYSIQSTLQSTYKDQNPNYTQGQQTLDSFLTTSGAGAKALQDYQTGYNTNNPLTNFNNEISGLNGQLSQAQQTTNKTQQDTQSAYDSALGGLQSQFNNQLSQLGQNNTSAQKAAADERAGLSKLDPTALSAAGLDSQKAKDLLSQNYNFNNLILDPRQQGLGDIANSGQVDQYNALLGLKPGSQSVYDFSKTGNTGNWSLSPSQQAYIKDFTLPQAPLQPTPVAAKPTSSSDLVPLSPNAFSAGPTNQDLSIKPGDTQSVGKSILTAPTPEQTAATEADPFTQAYNQGLTTNKDNLLTKDPYSSIISLPTDSVPSPSSNSSLDSFYKRLNKTPSA